MQKTRVLVVGACGETGRRVVAALARNKGLEVIASGRCLERLQQLTRAAEDQVGVRKLDINDNENLTAAIRASDIVVNCAGPMRAVEDKVASIAITEGRHYIDPGGSQKLHRRLLPRHQEATEKQLAVVVCAGWIAGVSEVLPYFLLEVARSRLVEINEFHAICGDANQWSETATQDFVNFVQSGDSAQRIGRQVRGKWRAEGLLRMWHRFTLPQPVGRITAFSRYQEEFSCLAADLEYPVISSNVALTSLSTLRIIRRIRTDESMDVDKARALLNQARERDQQKHPVKSFVAAQIVGRVNARRVVMSAVIVTEANYDATAASVAVTTLHAARKALRGTGVKYLSQAAIPGEFIKDLAKHDLHVVGL